MCTTLAVDARPLSLSLTGAIPRHDLFMESQIDLGWKEPLQVSDPTPPKQGQPSSGCPDLHPAHKIHFHELLAVSPSDQPSPLAVCLHCTPPGGENIPSEPRISGLCSDGGDIGMSLAGQAVGLVRAAGGHAAGWKRGLLSRSR